MKLEAAAEPDVTTSTSKANDAIAAVDIRTADEALATQENLTERDITEVYAVEVTVEPTPVANVNETEVRPI